jgi:hypothetical protein
MDGNTVLGTATVDANGQATLFLESLPSGAHNVTAIFGGDGNFLGSASALVTFIV